MPLETQFIYAAWPHLFKGEKNMDSKTNTNETLRQPGSNPGSALLCTEQSPLGYMPSHHIMYIIRFKALKLH